jgi:hypothetical protein
MLHTHGLLHTHALQPVNQALQTGQAVSSIQPASPERATNRRYIPAFIDGEMRSRALLTNADFKSLEDIVLRSH